MNKLEYPLNLLCAIYEITPEELENLPAYNFAEENIDEVLSELMDREQKVLIQRYKEKLSAYAVGRLYGVSCERIKQMEAKALRKLRHPTRSKKLKFETLDILDEKIAKLEQEVLELKAKMFLLSKSDGELISSDWLHEHNEDYSILSSNNVATYGDLKRVAQPILNMHSASGNEIHIIVEELLMKDLIKVESTTDEKYLVKMYELGLSMGTVRCLQLAGINTVQDFLLMINSPKNMEKVRYIGIRNVNKIINILDERGYDVSHLLQNNKAEKASVLSIVEDEDLSMEYKIDLLQRENDMLKEKLARCREILDSEFEEVEI